MIFGVLISRREVLQVFYRTTPFHEVSAASKNLWTFSRHEEPQVFHRTTPFHAVFEASMNLWTLSPPCEALQVSCKILVEEEVSQIGKYFLALLGHGKPEGHCMDPPGEVSELGKDLWRLSRHEVPQVSRKTPFVIEASARAGDGFLALSRHEEPAQAHHTPLADEVSQVAAGTEFKMFLHLEVLEARRRSTNATEEHLGAAVAIEEDQDTAIAAEDQGAAVAEDHQEATEHQDATEDQGAAAEEDQGTTVAEEDQGTAAAEEDQGTAVEEDQGTVVIAVAVVSHTQQLLSSMQRNQFLLGDAQLMAHR